jgi:hypothetical protein
MKSKGILIACLTLVAGLLLAVVLVSSPASLAARLPPTGTPPGGTTVSSHASPVDLAAQPAGQPALTARRLLGSLAISPISMSTGTLTITGTGWQEIWAEDFDGTFPPPGCFVADVSPFDGGEYLWGQRDCRALSGNLSIWAGGGGRDGENVACSDTYTNNLQTLLICGPFDLSQATDAESQFALWTDVEGDERGPVLIDKILWLVSIDGRSYSGLATAGETGDWIPVHSNLSSVPGLGDITGEPQVYLAWVFESNGSNPINYEGAFVDDVALWVYTGPLPTPPPPPPTSTSQVTCHTTVADFSGGRSLDSTVVVTRYGDGALTLAPQAELGEWDRLPSLPGELFDFAAVTAKGHLFVVGGNAPGGHYQGQVYSAVIQDDGLLGHWVDVTELPQALSAHAAVVVNDHLFVLGGFNADGFQATVFSAPVNDDGTLGPWTLLPPLPEPLAVSAAVSAHGYIYVLGGRISNAPLTVSGNIHRARVNADGTLDYWETLSTTLPHPSMWHEAVVTCDHLYFMAGQDAGIYEYSDVYQAEIQPDGSLGAWSPATFLPKTLAAHAAAAIRGGILVAGGWSSPDPVNTVQRNVYWAPLGPDCTLGNWVALTPLPFRTYKHALVATDRYVYILGGASSTSWVFASVLMAPLQSGHHSVQQGTFDHRFYLEDDFIGTLRWTAEGDDETGVSLRYRAGDTETGEYGPWSTYTSTTPVAVNASGGYLEYQLGFENGSGLGDKYVTEVCLDITSNTAPTIAGLPDQVVPMNSSADNAIDLWVYTSDAEDITATLTFTISNTPPISAGVTLDDNHYIDITPISGWTGASEVEVQVQDTGGLTDTDTFSITVLAHVYLPVVLRNVVR